MTIAIACNLADGVVMGVDSAVTISNVAGAPSKVFTDAEKLFTLWERPIAVAVWGLGSLEERTIGSYVREFETVQQAIKREPVEEVSKRLWRFLNGKYLDALQHANLTIPPEKRGVLGLAVGGFNEEAYLSEVWQVSAQLDDESAAVQCRNTPGFFGVVWFGQTEGITRFVKGCPSMYADMLYDKILQHYGVKADPKLNTDLLNMLDSWEYRFQFSGMPLQEGVDFVRFLLDIMINHSRFVEGAFGCGGPVRIVVVKTSGVEWVVSPKFRTSH